MIRAFLLALLLATGAMALDPQTITPVGTPAKNAVTVQGAVGGAAMPVSGSLTTTTNAVASASTTGLCISVTGSTSILAANAARKFATWTALAGNTAQVRFRLAGTTATVSDMPLAPGAAFNVDGAGGNIYTGAITAIAESGTQTICTAEY